MERHLYGYGLGFRRRGIEIILFAARVWGLRGSLGQGCASLATSRVSRSRLCEFGDFTGLKVVRVWRLHGSQGQGM